MTPMPKKRKAAIVLGTYALALIAVLGIFSYMSRRSLSDYRLAARYSAQEALEETVTAVSHMSGALKKSVYATDAGMRAKICAQVYADALAAEAAMSTLPFATQELEQISGYLNQVGDYAYTLCASAAAEGGFTGDEAENLAKLSALAASLTDSLSELQRSYHNGSIEMDSSETRLQNIGLDPSAGKVSTELLRYESEFPRRASMDYDGRYGAAAQLEESAGTKKLSDAEKLAVAAGFAGVSPAQIRLAYDYEGTNGVKCYAAGDTLVVVDDEGVESMGRSRLVSEERITDERAQQLAHDFLESHGYKDMTLIAAERAGGMARLKFASMQDDALCLDNFVTLSVALDDGTVCAFNAESYSNEACDVTWDVTETEAASAVPEGLEVTDVRKVIVRTEGKRAVGCYELICTDSDGAEVKIYVNAATGQQNEIVV